MPDTSPAAAFASPDDDDAWSVWRDHWQIRGDTLYLNHGSFGPPPRTVRQAQRAWKDRLDEQPMDFYLRAYEPAWNAARARLARFLGADADDLVFVENATSGMNVIADSIALGPGDQVLLNDHEYGAVIKIWRRACREAGADEPVIARLPLPIESSDQLVDALFAAATPRTRLIVVSQITSPTALKLPVREICERARRQGVAVCIDGAHAPAQVEVDIRALGCDYYVATCHKWLCAPLGAGALFVAPRHQAQVRPMQLSWGRLGPNVPERWSDEFVWTGTRDPSPYFTVPTAIDFLESVGPAAFRERTHALARYARQRLLETTGVASFVPDSLEWYSSMTLVPLPPVDPHWVYRQLQQRWGIETLAPLWNNRPLLRVSCHLYNRRADIDRLAEALYDVLQSR